MGGFDINQVLAIVITLLVMRGVRYVARTRFWSRIWANAQNKLDDPNVPIDSADKAVEAALLDEQRPTIQRLARSLRTSVPPETIGADDETPRLLRKGEP